MPHYSLNMMPIYTDRLRKPLIKPNINEPQPNYTFFK